VSIVQPSANGGTLCTAGNIVFEGTAQGNLEAYRADNGQKLWSADAQSGVVAAPMTYTVNGEQYVAVLAGGAASFLWPEVKSLSLPSDAKYSAAARLQTKQQSQLTATSAIHLAATQATKVHRQCCHGKKG